MEFLTQNIIEIITTFFGASGLAMYVFERRKNKAEAKGVEAETESKEIDNGSKIIDLYKAALDDLERRCEKKYQEMEALYDKKNEVLQQEIIALETAYKRKVKLLEDEIKLKNKVIITLRKDVRERDAEIKNLKVKLKNVDNCNT